MKQLRKTKIVGTIGPASDGSRPHAIVILK